MSSHYNREEDDASIAQRQVKIDEMRARVEARLESLLRGDSLGRLRQQVSDLRESTARQSLEQNATTMEQQQQQQQQDESILLLVDDDDNVPFGAEHGDIHFDPSVATTTLPPPPPPSHQEDEEIVFDPREPIFVERAEIQDPYGDAGSYTGFVNPTTQRPCGKGTMEYYDGRTYQGDWKDGRWHGTVKVQFANGDMYQGDYVKDQRSGVGKYTWKDGRVYEGSFRDDQRNGMGEYKWPDGACYKGFFRAGHRDGEGEYRFADGSVYTGEWKEGKYHGLGECRWADGRVYKGEWNMGKAHGYGIETRANGTLRHDGEWFQDEPVRKHKKKKSRV
jgi:hypothetical protein